MYVLQNQGLPGDGRDRAGARKRPQNNLWGMVKVGFAFGYRIGSAGKYLVPKMHLIQLKIINLL
jgi:hypothetical protein